MLNRCIRNQDDQFDYIQPTDILGMMSYNQWMTKEYVASTTMLRRGHLNFQHKLLGEMICRLDDLRREVGYTLRCST